MELRQTILKYALQNAVFFEGKATAGAVIGKVLAEHPELKQKVKELSQETQRVVKEVNALSADEQRYQLKNIAPELMEKKSAEKKGLPELKNAVMGKVVTRLPPEPSKHIHIGHALSFLINYLYAQKYKGKCVLRFEDTNPELSKQEYVDSIVEDLKFLGIKPNKTVFASDDMSTFYSLAEQMIEKGQAYACFCSREKMQDLRHKGLACECREKAPEENLKEWSDMLKGKYGAGKCVLRLKGDMGSTNQVMRDPVIFRICTEPHYLHKKRYSVWPMYDFENAVEDELCGVTHILRSIEFGQMRVELQNFIKELLGFRKQEVVQYGRFNVAGAVTQGREIRKAIDEKRFRGWDDPRLVTIKALVRRGIKKETFYELALEVGLSSTPTNIDWSVISAISRKILDPNTNRYFFIDDPKEIAVTGAPSKTEELKLHPDHPEKGMRKFKVGEKFFISQKDLAEIKNNELIRLMDCLNFRKKGKSFVFDSEDYETYREDGKKIIHWLPADKSQVVDVEVMMPDATVRTGLGEASLKKLKVGEIVQFTRFGFCRLDKKDASRLSFWFTHE